MKKAQMQQMADQANTERQMMSNQQAQEGKERLEQIKIIGNVIGEYAKAAFANPMNTQNPELILQRIQLELEKMYGNTGNANGEQPSAGGPPIPAGGAEQLAVQGGARFLNVLQGDNHTSAEEWYQQMKHFCDPAVYPDRHFDGWGMGGQNMCDVHLILKRLVTLRYDNLLQEGKHDWMHFLGTSKLEWAVLLTVIQRAVRKYVNPQFTISFDCASPFLATANGQVYFENVFEHNQKWSYRMAPSADDKKYSTDTRKWGTGVVADGIYPRWEDSPISQPTRPN